jgi:hypothetical protein
VQFGRHFADTQRSWQRTVEDLLQRAEDGDPLPRPSNGDPLPLASARAFEANDDLRKLLGPAGWAEASQVGSGVDLNREYRRGYAHHFKMIWAPEMLDGGKKAELLRLDLMTNRRNADT